VAVIDVERTGETEATSGALFGSEIFLTSAMVKLAARDWVPVEETPRPNRPVLNTVNVLVPRAAMRCSTARVEPVPTATRMMTAETPMSTPSMVSNERSLLEVTPPRAMRNTSR